MKGYHRQVMDSLRREGFTVVDFVDGNHPKIMLQRDGHQFYLVVSGTPKNPTNAVMHALQDARRAFRAALCRAVSVP